MLVASMAALTACADYKDEVGFASLASELGATMPTGAGIPLTQVEAGADYMPDTSNSEFSGKTIMNVNGSSSNVSSHATGVGQYFYGANTSLSPGANGVSVYSADYWLTSWFLKDGSSQPPAIETNLIQNHSWIATDWSTATSVIRRLDHAIARDGFTAVVGVNNGSNSVVPDLLGHSYNAISVGLSSGDHSRNGTTFEEAGRTKPDIVAPLTLTSHATPLVGSAAALLMEEAFGTPAWTNAMKTESIKALLMAGATKDEFADWNRTPARPLDRIYGAGELNIRNSYHVLVAGEQAPSATSLVSRIGWSYSAIGPGTNIYFFEVPPGNAITRLSLLLAWNRVVTDGPGPGFDPEAFMPNLGLYLRASSAFTCSNLLDVSTSAVDNVEHIYYRSLREGQYAVQVTSDSSCSYALAWFSQLASIPIASSPADMAGSMQIRSSVSSNVAYAMEASADLQSPTNWLRLATNTSASNTWVFVDSGATNALQRFYRLVADP